MSWLVVADRTYSVLWKSPEPPGVNFACTVMLPPAATVIGGASTTENAASSVTKLVNVIGDAVLLVTTRGSCADSPTGTLPKSSTSTLGVNAVPRHGKRTAR